MKGAPPYAPKSRASVVSGAADDYVSFTELFDRKTVRHATRQQRTRARAARLQRILAYRAQGLTLKAIGEIEGVRKQRVEQILK